MWNSPSWWWWWSLWAGAQNAFNPSSLTCWAGTSKRVSGNLPSTVHPGIKIENKPSLFLEKVAFQSKQPQPWECLSSSAPVSGHKQATNSQTWPLSGRMPLASGSLTPPSWFLGGGQKRSSSRAVFTLSHKSCPAHKSWFEKNSLKYWFLCRGLKIQGADRRQNSFYSAMKDLKLATLAELKHLLLPSLNPFRGHQGLVTPSAHCKLALILHNSVFRW